MTWLPMPVTATIYTAVAPSFIIVAVTAVASTLSVANVNRCRLLHLHPTAQGSGERAPLDRCPLSSIYYILVGDQLFEAS